MFIMAHHDVPVSTQTLCYTFSAAAFAFVVLFLIAVFSPRDGKTPVFGPYDKRKKH